METRLQVPHGGALVNLLVDKDAQTYAVEQCNRTQELSDRNACDVELLCVGYAFVAILPPAYTALT